MSAPARRRRPRAPWVPNQHGAWAMLVVPFLLGLALAVRHSSAGWWLLPLFGCWMLGYGAFHAASGALKASPRRRPPYLVPLATYAATSAVLGVLALVLGGWSLAWWALPYLPLLLPALWLAAQRRERSTLGGALTVAAASLMLVVARYPDPADALTPGALPTWLAALLVFGYFFGTVLYVKTNIRERGSTPWLIGSLTYHGVAAIGTVPAAFAGLVAWWWPTFFLLCTLRAGLVPPRRWTPKRIGVLEIALSTLLVACFAVWPPGTQ